MAYAITRLFQALGMKSTVLSTDTAPTTLSPLTEITLGTYRTV